MRKLQLNLTEKRVYCTFRLLLCLFRFLSKRYMCVCSWCHFFSFSWSCLSQSLCVFWCRSGFLLDTKQYIWSWCWCQWCWCQWYRSRQSLWSNIGCQLLHWNKTSDIKSNCRWSTCWRSSTATCISIMAYQNNTDTVYYCLLPCPVETCIPN